MKKIMLVLLSLMVLCSCSTKEQEETQKMQESTKEKFLYFTNYKNYQASLIKYDVEKQKEVKNTALLKAGYMYQVSKFIELDEGIAVIANENANGEEIDVEEGSLFSSAITDSQNMRQILFLFDFDLNLEKEIDLKSIFGDVNSDAPVSFSISKNGQNIASASLNALYIYNDKTKETRIICDEKENDIYFDDITILNNDKIAYTGSSINDDKLHFGYFSLEENKFYREKEQFAVNGNIYATDTSIYFNDLEKPNTKAGKGKVLGYHLDEKKCFEYVVNDGKSHNSRISPDGKYLVGVSRKSNANGSVTGYNIAIYSTSDMQEIMNETIESSFQLSSIFTENDRCHILFESLDSYSIYSLEYGGESK